MSRSHSCPRVVFAVRSESQVILQDHPNVVFACNDADLPWPAFFNAVINQKLGHVVACIGDASVICAGTARVVAQMFSNYHKMVGVVYFDCVQQYYTSFSFGPVDTPLFINGAITGKLFDETLSVGYFSNALDALSTKSIIYHIPKIALDLEPRCLTPVNEMSLV